MILGVVSILLITATALVIRFFSDIRKVENQLKRKNLPLPNDLQIDLNNNKNFIKYFY